MAGVDAVAFTMLHVKPSARVAAIKQVPRSFIAPNMSFFMKPDGVMRQLTLTSDGGHEIVFVSNRVAEAVALLGLPAAHALFFGMENGPSSTLHPPVVVYKLGTFRVVMWFSERACTPDYDGTVSGDPSWRRHPMFSLQDGVQPGTWWRGDAYLVAYARNGSSSSAATAAQMDGFLAAVAGRITWGPDPTPGAPPLFYNNDNVKALVARCAACNAFDQTKTALLCAGCRCVYYCSAECQRAHWAMPGNHKAACKESQRLVKGVS